MIVLGSRVTQVDVLLVDAELLVGHLPQLIDRYCVLAPSPLLVP